MKLFLTLLITLITVQVSAQSRRIARCDTYHDVAFECVADPQPRDSKALEDYQAVSVCTDGAGGYYLSILQKQKQKPRFIPVGERNHSGSYIDFKGDERDDNIAVNKTKFHTLRVNSALGFNMSSRGYVYLGRPTSVAKTATFRCIQRY
jgi:hypothetical protein